MSAHEWIFLLVFCAWPGGYVVALFVLAWLLTRKEDDFGQ